MLIPFRDYTMEIKKLLKCIALASQERALVYFFSFFFFDHIVCEITNDQRWHN